MTASSTAMADSDPPTILFDPWPRSAEMIFGGDMQSRFECLGRIVGIEEGGAGKLPADIVDAALPDTVAIVGQTDLDARRLSRAPKLRAIINVEGNFQQNVDFHDPWLPDASIRELLSSHRAGGVPLALASIGEMVVDDLGLILRGLPPQRLQAARAEAVVRWRNPAGRSYAPGTRL